MQWMLFSLYFFHLKQISKSKATEQWCGGSPCLSVLTVAKCSCDGHRYLKAGEEQFILPGDFSTSLLAGHWPQRQMRHSESLTVSQGTWNGQHTVKSQWLNWSSSRVAFCVADLSLSMAGHRAVTSYTLSCLFYEGVLSVRASGFVF